MEKKHVHLIGVAGTGMGSLAGLLAQAGHEVSGSDRHFYPPMGGHLADWGVRTCQGYEPTHLTPRPDLVVVGNVCRKDNPEARAAIDGGLAYMSMPQAIEEMFLQQRPGYVVAGTHGKTTTTALVTYLLQSLDRDPGFLIGGVPQGFDRSFGIGASDAPFVLEGDEYDSAFFEKKPKFWRYRPLCAVVTSLEHDHIDIYPDMDSYRAAFEEFVRRIPPQGLLVAYAGDPEVRKLASQARCRVSYYALDRDDTGDVQPHWSAALAPSEGGMQPMDVFFGGSACGRALSPLSGAHNARNALAALAMCSEGAGLAVSALLRSLRSFRGVRRRQELMATAGGVRIYDDFAHHPTAVRETLAGLRARHPEGKLVAVFEPRSATASRRLHQQDYPKAFTSADVSLLAPVGRPEVGEAERLDVAQLARGIAELGEGHAEAPADHDQLLARILAHTAPGDTLVLMSNGDFKGLPDRAIAALTVRQLERGEPS